MTPYIIHTLTLFFRQLVDPLILYFNGSGQHNYGREMIYYRWLLSDACTPELQHAILASGLINTTGKPMSFKPIDQNQEHHNLMIATSFRNYGNSTHDEHIIFHKLCLTSTAAGNIIRHMERTFGQSIPTTHTTAGTVGEVLAHCRLLFKNSLCRPRTDADLNTLGVTASPSVDVVGLGRDRLLTEIGRFNSEYILPADRVSTGNLTGVDAVEAAELEQIVPVIEDFMDEFDDVMEPDD